MGNLVEVAHNATFLGVMEVPATMLSLFASCGIHLVRVRIGLIGLALAFSVPPNLYRRLIAHDDAKKCLLVILQKARARQEAKEPPLSGGERLHLPL